MSRSSQPKTTPRTTPASPSREAYRLSNRAISTITITLVVMMFVLLAVSLLVLWLGDLSGSHTAELWGVLILVTAFGLPVFAGAIFGGLALSHWGWIAGLLFGSGWVLIVFLISNDSFRLIYDGRSLGPIPFSEDVWRFVAVAGMVVGGALYFVFGFLSFVPITVGGVPLNAAAGRKLQRRR
ncbi:MAG: hypothetical protein ACTJGT_08560 [Microbacteriaceae bacterium]